MIHNSVFLGLTLTSQHLLSGPTLGRQITAVAPLKLGPVMPAPFPHPPNDDTCLWLSREFRSFLSALCRRVNGYTESPVIPTRTACGWGTKELFSCLGLVACGCAERWDWVWGWELLNESVVGQAVQLIYTYNFREKNTSIHPVAATSMWQSDT